MATSWVRWTAPHLQRSGGKISGTVREMVLEALAEKGGTKWLKQQMDKNPAAYMALLGKVLPMQVTGANEGPLVIRWMDETEQE